MFPLNNVHITAALNCSLNENKHFILYNNQSPVSINVITSHVSDSSSAR
jgi:hypothetical protein